MAVEKFIRGKRDDCHHEGKRASVRRLQEAIEDQAVGEQLYVSMQVYRQREKLPDYLVDYHRDILTVWGFLPEIEMKPNTDYPLDTVGNDNIE